MLLTAIVCFLGLGQTVETPVSFDTPGQVFRLAPEANEKAGVLPELLDFDHAELWRLDSVVRVEVYRRDSTRTGRVLTQPELDAIRTRMDAYLGARPAQPVLNQEGRGRFLFEQIPLALGWYGPSAVMILQPDDGRTGAAAYLLTGAAGYFVPMMYTSRTRLTNAQSHLSVAMGYRGILAGYLLSDVLQVHVADGDGPRWNAFFMLGTSVGGQFTGWALADRLTLGQATLVTSYTDVGTLCGFLSGVIVEQTFFYKEWRSTPLSVTTLAGMAGGAVAGVARTQSLRCTEGQVIAGRTGALLLAAVPATLYYAATGANLLHRDEVRGRPDLEVMSALAICGALTGTWWTTQYLRDKPFSTSGGYIVAGTTIGGGLLGAGLGVVVNTQDVEARWVAATAAAGGMAGFWGGLKLAEGLREPAGRAGPQPARFELNVAALAGAATQYSQHRSFSAPNLVTVRF
jgi:hypothetical protein